MIVGLRFAHARGEIFLSFDPGFAPRLGSCGRVTDKLDKGRIVVEFSAEADCVLMPKNRYRIVDLRVGKFGE
jgi:hypothetical protein